MTDYRADYYSQIENFENQVTHVTEHILQEQERLRNSTLQEFNQTVSQLIADHEVFALEGQCDPAAIDASLKELEAWTESLKQVHLELESIDNFLRYIIPSNQKLSDLSEFNQEKCESLTKEVVRLRDVDISALLQDISSYQQKITDKSDENLAMNETIKETCLEVSEDIDQCWKLLEQVESYEQSTVKDKPKHMDPIQSTYDQWKWNQLAETELTHLNQQLETLKDTKEKLSAVIAKRSELKPSPKLMEMFTTYQLLTKFWKSQFIANLLPEVKNLEVYPQSGKLQFEVESIELTVCMQNGVIQTVTLFSHELSYDQIDSIKQGILIKVQSQKRSLFEVLVLITDYIIQSLKLTINA